MHYRLGNWADDPCFYVSVIDAETKRSALLAGPFVTHDFALAALLDATRIAVDIDPRGAFYAYGTCRHENGHSTGSLNSRLASAHPEINRGAWN